jgi:hypothetical protein
MTWVCKFLVGSSSNFSFQQCFFKENINWVGYY